VVEEVLEEAVLEGEVLAAAAGVAALGPGKQDLFVSGTDDYHTYRIPALIVSDKTIIAFCEARKNSRKDKGDIDIVVRTSKDNGNKWSRMRVVHDDGRNTVGNPCPVFDKKTGDVWLAFCRNNNKVFVTRSRNNGRSWSDPLEITDQVSRRNWAWYATGPGHGLQLRNGRLLIPCNHKEKGLFKRTRSHIFYSDDGNYWSLGGTIPKQSNECMVAETSRGAYLNARTSITRRRRLHAWSRDGGESWFNMGYHNELVDSVCQASVTSFNNTFFFCNPSSLFRKNLTIRFSKDNCRTWSKGRTIHKGPSAYSDMSVLKDRVLCLFENGDKHPYERITLSSFGVDWLTSVQ
jgi:sialidase-1